MFNLKTQWSDVKGNVKWDIAKWAGAAMIGALTFLLHRVGRIPDWALGASIFLLALAVFWWASRSPKVKGLQQPLPTSSTQAVVQAVGLETNIQAFEDIYKQNAGQLRTEVEQRFRQMAAHFTNPTERENFLMRVLAGCAVRVLHDETWWVIWRSQIELLQELNSHMLTVAQAKGYYDAAAKAYPATYANYSFEQWLNYLRTQTLIAQPGSIAITVKGKDFLRYLVQEDRSAKDRFN